MKGPWRLTFSAAMDHLTPHLKVEATPPHHENKKKK